MHRVAPSETTLRVVFPFCDASGVYLGPQAGTLLGELYKNGVGYKNASTNTIDIAAKTGVCIFTGLELASGDRLTAMAGFTVSGAGRKLRMWEGWVDNAPITSGEVETIVTNAINSGGSYPITWPLTDSEATERELVRRDDYSGDRVVLVTVATSEDLTGATYRFGAGRDGQTIAGTVALQTDNGDGTYVMAVTLTAAELTKPIGIYGWDLVATIAGKERTLRRGRFRLLEKYAAAA